MEHKRNAFWRTLAALMLFGVSFGFVEATVVVYERELYQPLAIQLNPERKLGELFPLLTLEQLEASDTGHLKLLKIEVIREAATIVMLAAVGLAVGWNFNTCFAGLVVSFGVWDICYYVFLKWLIDWPAAILDWDILFLIPVPWVGPVLAPVLVAISMVVTGTLLIWHESTGIPVHISWQHWAIMVLGGVIIVVAFCWDYVNMMAGGMPNSFPWSLFLFGEAIGLAGYVLAFVRRDVRFSIDGVRSP